MENTQWREEEGGLAAEVGFLRAREDKKKKEKEQAKAVLTERGEHRQRRKKRRGASMLSESSPCDPNAVCLGSAICGLRESAVRQPALPLLLLLLSA